MANLENTPVRYQITYPIPEGGFTADKNGNPQYPSAWYAIALINNKYDSRYNEVLQRTEVKKVGTEDWAPLDDKMLNTMFLLCYSDNNASITKEMLRAFFESSFLFSFDPFLQYFATLPAWDGETDYIGKLSDTVQTSDNKAWRLYLEKWLVALAICSCRGSFTNQSILVLYGKQGVGKTRWIRKLLPSRLKEYMFTGYNNIRDKDLQFRMASNLVFFLDELDSYSNNEMSILKSYITQEEVKQRKHYGSFDSILKRRASFIAALNNEKFIADTTGNRRFLVVEAIEINHSHNINMDNVFSQVISLYKKNGDIGGFFNSIEIEEIQKRNERFRLKTDIENFMEEYFVPCTKSDKGCEFMTATEIQSYLVSKAKISATSVSPQKLGKLLGILGYENAHKGTGNEKRNGYFIKKKVTQITQLPNLECFNEEELTVLGTKKTFEN